MLPTPLISMLRRRRRRNRTATRGRRRLVPISSRIPMLELLEPRQLLATINWANRGSTSDRFASTFGADAALARGVVDAAIDAWDRVITDYNRPSGGETINVNISMESTGTGFGASAVVTSHLGGFPTAGSITIGRGDDTNSDGRGDGDGYFLDPTPHEHSEFTGPILHAFTGNALSGSPAAGKSDLFTLVVHELTHVIGIVAFSQLKLHNPLNGTITDTGLADDSEGDGTGNYFVFDGPSVTHLMSSNNGGSGGQDAGRIVHSAGPNLAAPNQPVTFESDFRGTLELVGAEDIVNAIYEFGRRYVPTDYIALILQDAYGYSIELPQTFGTFYALLDESTGELLVRGQTGNDSDDAFHISLVGDNVRVSVDLGDDTPGSGPNGDDSDLLAYVDEFPLASIASITVQAGSGDDTLVVDFSGGDPLPDGGLEFSGSFGSDDVLTIDLAGAFEAAQMGVTDGTVFVTTTNKSITFSSVETVVAMGGSFAATPMLTVGPPELNEGESVLLDLLFNPGVGEHTVTIDWGDGDVDVVPLAAGANEIIGLSRIYADDAQGGAPEDEYIISVSVEDEDQTVVFDGTATVTVHNIAPAVTSLALNPDTVEMGGQATLTGTFDDPGALDTFFLDIDADGDGAFESSGIPVSGGAFSVDLTFNEPPGTHAVNVRLQDDDGGSNTQSTSVTITLPPVPLGNLRIELDGVAGPGASPSVNEADVVTLTGIFDASLAEHNVLIDWGDGTTDTLLLIDSVYAFTTTHVYPDDEPSITPQDAYMVTVVVEENAAGGDAIMNNNAGDPVDQVVVHNVAPFISSLTLSPNIVLPGGVATLSGAFSDPGSLDTFQLDLDADGDGTFEIMGMPVVDGAFSADITFNEPLGAHAVNVRLHDDDGGMSTQSTTITIAELLSQLLDVHLFYNNSAFDGNGPLVDASDFAAIAEDKTPLLPGSDATFANISGYSRGINGMFFDFDGLPDDGAGVDAGDFLFRVGNDNDADAWASGPLPDSVGVLANQGTGGADRVYITFADGAVANTWLRVTVAAGADTGLADEADFFFGSAAGETGASFVLDTVGVDAADLQLIASNITPLANAGTEPVTQVADVNRDRTVNAFDLQVVAVNLSIGVIDLITPQIGGVAVAVFAASVAPSLPLSMTQSNSATAAKDVAFEIDAARDPRIWHSGGNERDVRKSVRTFGKPRWDFGMKYVASKHIELESCDLAIESLMAPDAAAMDRIC